MKSIKLDWKYPDRIERIQKSFTPRNEFFAAFSDTLANEGKCLCICAFEPGKVAYLDEFASDGWSKGVGFEALKQAVDFKYEKMWLMASPMFDKSKDVYVEAVKLNEKYREQSWLKEIRLQAEENGWNCPVSLFSTQNVSDREVKKLFAEKFQQ